MAMKGEITVKNHEGTQLEGPRENSSSLVFEFDHQVYLPFDQEENRVQGSRRIGAFTVIKDIAKARDVRSASVIPSTVTSCVSTSTGQPVCPCSSLLR